MDTANRQALLQIRRQLLDEFDRVQAALGNGSSMGPRPEARAGRFASLSPGKAIRRLLIDEGVPCDRYRIAWELANGNALVSAKRPEENIQRAIDVNLELGLLIQNGDEIGLPEWGKNERPLHRVATDERVRFVIGQMHESLGSGITVAELAHEVGLSASRLSHLFQEELSVSPLEYMRRIRTRVVSSMLRKTHLKQREILSIAGVSDRSHFSREFKRIFRRNPSQVRQSASKPKLKRGI